MSYLTAFLILLKLLRSVDGLKELSISPSSSTRVVSIHFSGQFPGVLSKFPSKEDHFNFHQSQFFSFLTWSAEKGFAWTFPSFSKRWASVHFHGSASHKHRQVFSSTHSSLPHHPSSNCQFKFIYTKLTADTASRSLNLWETWPCIQTLRLNPAFLFFLFLVLTADNITRWLSVRMSVWAEELGDHFDRNISPWRSKNSNCNNNRHSSAPPHQHFWVVYIFIWK